MHYLWFKKLVTHYYNTIQNVHSYIFPNFRKVESSLALLIVCMYLHLDSLSTTFNDFAFQIGHASKVQIVSSLIAIVQSASLMIVLSY